LRIEKEEYFIAIDGNDKKALFKARQSSRKGWPIAAVKANSKQETKDAEIEKFDEEDILTNFGLKPPYGSFLGVKIEPWRRTVELKGWGEMNLYLRTKQENVEILKEKFIKVAARLRKRHLDGFLPLNIEIRPRLGRTAGHYSFQSNGVDTLVVYPDSINFKNELFYIILHESGHGVYSRLMSQKMKSSWIKLYHQYVLLNNASVSLIKRLSNDFVDTKEPIAKYKKGLNDKEQVVFGYLLDWISSVHHIPQKSLNTLISAEMHDEIRSYMPDREIIHSDFRKMTTEYSQKNPEELFCESFAYFLMGKKLDEPTEKLMRKTLFRIGGVQ
jgi:hypothetical protein